MKKIFILIIALFNFYISGGQNKPNSSNTGPTPTAPILVPNINNGILAFNVTRIAIPKIPVKTNTELSNALSQPHQSLFQTNYTDGKGRVQQKIIRRPTIIGKDLVSSQIYELDGRSNSSFLPFCKSESGDAYVRNFNQKMRDFYNSIGYTNESYLYGKTSFETSPLRRTLNSESPGNSWTGNNKNKSTELRVIKTNNLLKITLPTSSSTLPLIGGTIDFLTEIIEKDEDFQTTGNLRKKFFNAEGLLACEVTGNSSNNLYTYYVYDIHGQLRITVTPKATAAILANNNTFTSEILDKLCFQNEYDEFGRISGVKKPETGFSYYVYDQKDRIILSQDAIMRQQNKWLFTKYDQSNRVIQSGTYNGTFIANTPTTIQLPSGLNQAYPSGATVPFTRTLLQNQVNNNTQTDPFLIYLTNAEVQHYSQYQTNFNNVEISLTQIYDNYVLSNLDFGVNTGSHTDGYKVNKSNKTHGMLTQTISKTSNNIEIIKEAYYYNERGETIQKTSIGNNNKIRYHAFGYDFNGRLIKTILRHKDDFVIYRKVTYDVFDRITKIEHKINNSSNYRPIARYFYDDLGRLSIRKLGGMGYNINYEYNIRNWLTGINKSFALTKNNDDFFGMEISYDKGFDKCNLNGNISGIKWRSKGTSGEQRSYGYEYDFAGRLTKGDYYQKSENYPNDWLKTEKDFTTNNLSYDANGNILTMNHKGLNLTKDIISLDELNYTYETNSNRLLGIHESSSSDSKDPSIHDGLADFRDAGTNNGTDYGFDANGNRSSDLNKGIVSINNNWIGLNKPITVEFANNNKIEYVYDAFGTLIQKKITQTLNNQTTTFDYIDEVIYKNGVVNSLSHDEGRIRFDAANNTYMYDYFVRDHIENVRSIISESQVNSIGNGTPISGITWPSQSVPASLNNGDGTLGNDNSFVSNGDGIPPTPFLYLATSEIQYDTLEEEFFDNLDETRSSRPFSSDPTNQKSARLVASEGKILGPGILLEVMAGDQIQLGMEALFFSNSNPQTSVPLSNIITSIVGALSGTGGLLDGVGAASQATNLDPVSMTMAITQLQSGARDTTKPNAFLNYLFFDESMKVIQEESGALQVNQANAWYSLSKPIFTVNRNGYVYVYSCNTSEGIVRTDNLVVTLFKGSLLEEFHYYPFGLCFEASVAPTLSKSSDNKYNCQFLEQDEFTDAQGKSYGLDYYNFAARNYDPQTGRWLQEDPHMQHASPFLAMRNNPVSFTDPLGLDDDHIGVDKDGNIVGYAKDLGPDRYYLLTSTGPGTYSSDGINESEYQRLRDLYYRNLTRDIARGLLTSSASYTYEDRLNYVMYNSLIQANEFNKPHQGDYLVYEAAYVNTYRTEGYLIYKNAKNEEVARYKATSGAANQHAYTIPRGQWQGGSIDSDVGPRFKRNGVGFKIILGPDRFDPLRGRIANEIRIHPVPGNGTLGCIGLKSEAELLKDFMNRYKNYYNKFKCIDIYVNYAD